MLGLLKGCPQSSSVSIAWDFSEMQTHSPALGPVVRDAQEMSRPNRSERYFPTSHGLLWLLMLKASSQFYSAMQRSPHSSSPSPLHMLCQNWSTETPQRQVQRFMKQCVHASLHTFIIGRAFGDSIFLGHSKHPLRTGQSQLTGRWGLGERELLSSLLSPFQAGRKIEHTGSTFRSPINSVGQETGPLVFCSRQQITK